MSLDTLAAALFALSVTIAVTGGGIVAIGHRTIGLRSPDHALIALALLLSLRYRLLARVPFFGRSVWSKAGLERAASMALERLARAPRPATAMYVVVAAARRRASLARP